MFHKSNSLIGIVNFISFLLSIPILGGGIWLAARANSTDCLRFLQWPVIIIGLSIMVVSLAGFAGACYRLPWLLRFYLFAMFIIVVALLFFIVFAYAVTDRGSGNVVVSRSFLEYQLSDYSGWLKDRVTDPEYWKQIRSCLQEGKACSGMRRLVRDSAGVVMAETQDMFDHRSLNPIQSGCCKPPTSCGLIYFNETVWTPNPTAGSVVADADCSLWSNDQQTLCFNCDSCKAGVLAQIKQSWRKISIINIVVLIVLVIVYAAGCAAFRNAKRADNNEPFGESQMTKARPSRWQY